VLRRGAYGALFCSFLTFVGPIFPGSPGRKAQSQMIQKENPKVYSKKFIFACRGYVVLEHSSVSKNMADGVKYYFHDQRPETKMVDGVDVHDFCTYSTTYSQTYPFLMVAEQYEDSAVDR